MKKLFVVGIGPGGYTGITLSAIRALEESEVIAGYTLYCGLVREHYPDKEYIDTPMLRELERCRMALESASGGKTTSLICSGDAGVYGMASPVLELADEYDAEIEIIPGVSASLSGAALLGSPLTCDYMTLSLSDLLTPRETIEKRIDCAGLCDICLAIYNPASKRRKDLLRICCDILLKYRSPETVCGVAVNIGRAGEHSRIMTLADLRDYEADMFTTVFIGNSSTKSLNGRMVTPRGYRTDA